MTTNLVLVDPAHEPRPKAVRRRLREEFARIDVKTSEVARRVSMTQPALSRRMTGDIPFKLDELDLICATLGLSYEYVMLGIREIPSGGPPTTPASASRYEPTRGGQLLRLLSDAAEPIVPPVGGSSAPMELDDEADLAHRMVDLAERESVGGPSPHLNPRRVDGSGDPTGDEDQPIEPPDGVEPSTYSLRVNRSQQTTSIQKAA